jgi:hypothetical protein
LKVFIAENVFGEILSGFVETVHVELSDEGVDVAVSEVKGQNLLLEELYILDGELFS